MTDAAPRPSEELRRWLRDAGRVVVLSGAGISTESGIPDYRGPSGTARRSTPMTYQVFTSDPAARQRYWARSAVGWRHVARAAPNAGHRAVATLQALGHVSDVITQNVDGLHQRAGTRHVEELHGNLDRVVCLDCRGLSSRLDLARRLRERNPGFDERVVAAAPDGDADLPDDLVRSFSVAPCEVCGGTLKPDVVFFGETVPRDRVARCLAAVDAADALLVLGSSLAVQSGYRFVLRAREQGIPVGVVNRGRTRADAAASLRVDARLGAVLPEVADQLCREALTSEAPTPGALTGT